MTSRPRHRRPFLATALLAAAVTGTCAPTQQEPASFAETVTDAGMRIWSFPDDGGQRFLMMALVGVGARDEDPDQAGIAHFLEHVLFASTQAASKREHDRELDLRGCAVNGFTSHECTTYYIRAGADEWRFAVDWLAQHVVRPAFATEDIEAERRIVYEEIDLRNPHAGAVTIEGLLYPDHALGRDIAGDRDGLADISADDLRRFYAEHYVAGNVAVGFAGRAPRSECVAAIRTAFESLPHGGVGSSATPVRPVADTIILGAGERRRKSGQLSLGYHLPGGGARELSIAIAMAAYLEERFFLEVREARQLAYAPSVDLSHFRDTHRLQFDVRVSDQRNLETVVQICDALVAELQTPDPLALSGALAASGGLLEVNSTAELGAVMRLGWLLRRKGQSPAALLTAPVGLGFDDFARYAEENLVPENRFLVSDSPLLRGGPGALAGLVLVLVVLVVIDGFRGFAAARSVAEWWTRRRRPRRKTRKRAAKIVPIRGEELEASIQRYLEEQDENAGDERDPGTTPGPQ